MMHFDGSVVVASHGTGLVKLVLLMRRDPGSVAPELLPFVGALALSFNEAYSVTGVNGGNENVGSGYSVSVQVLRSPPDAPTGKVTMAVLAGAVPKSPLSSFVRSAWLAPSAPYIRRPRMLLTV